MKKFLQWIWEKWLAWRNKKLEEAQRKEERAKELEVLRKLQYKKKQLDKLRSDESHKP